MLLETLEYLGIAFISSVLLIIMSKIILQALIRRPADYYNARELREEELMLNAGGISITNEHETNPEGEIIEDKHLEAQMGDIEPAEPEDILPEVPEAVAESLEVHPDEAEEDVEDVPVPEEAEAEIEEVPAEETEAGTEETLDAEETVEQPAPELEEESAEEPVEQPSEEQDAIDIAAEPETEETEEDIEAAPAQEAEEEPEEAPVTEEVEGAESESEEAPAVVEAEAEIEKVPAEETEADTEETFDAEETAEQPAPEPVEEPKTPEEAFGFSIKAKTSRVRKPKKKEEEEAAEELEEAKAAMDEARARGEAPEPVSGWTESYAEIRDSLEKAFTERRRKPSMHMNKKELTDIAQEMGIELPHKATKREILDLINEKNKGSEE